MIRQSIGIIGGVGWLGRAIGLSMLKAGFVGQDDLRISGRRQPPSDVMAPFSPRFTTDNRELVETSDIILLSVRPDQFGPLQLDAGGKLVISVMAGVSAKTIAAQMNTDRVVRALPNAAAEIGKSYTPWFPAPEVSSSQKDFVQALFETCGVADEMPREADIDYLTGLTGSGPAFPALLADAMISHARAKGLSEEIAERAVVSVIAGAGQLLLGGHGSPGTIVQTFRDYRGTTAAGLDSMIARGFIDAVHSGLEAAEAAALRMSAKGEQ